MLCRSVYKRREMEMESTETNLAPKLAVESLSELGCGSGQIGVVHEVYCTQDSINVEAGLMNGISSAFSTATGPLNGMAAGMPGAFHSRKSAIEAVVMEAEKKGRKAIESSVNGSNGGGSRKRSRVSLPFELSHVGGFDLENGTSTRTNGTAQAAGGMRECAAFLEKREKRTICRQGADRWEKRVSQTNSSPANDAQLRGSWIANDFQTGNPGILDIYGLMTESIDISVYMEEISVNDLLSGNYTSPTVFSNEPVAPVQVAELNFEKQIQELLQSISKCSEVSVNGNQGNKEGSCPSRLGFDLEAPVSMDEDILSNVVNGDVQQREFDRAFMRSTEVAAKEPWCNEPGTLPSENASGSLPAFLKPRFCVDDLPLYPLEDFMSRLQLPSSDSLEQFVSQTGAERVALNQASRCATSSCSSEHYATRTLPPFPFSLPPSEPFKVESIQRKGLRGGRARATELTPSQGSQGGLTHKEGHNGLGGENSGDGHRETQVGRMDDPSKARDTTQFYSPPGPQTPSPLQETGPTAAGTSLGSSLVSPTTVKIETRHVESAVDLNLNGFTLDTMDPYQQETQAGNSVIERKVEVTGGSSLPPPVCKSEHGLGDLGKGPRVQTSSGGRASSTLRPSSSTGNEMEMQEASQEVGGASKNIMARKGEIPRLDVKSLDGGQCSRGAHDPLSSYSEIPGSPNALAAAHLLCDLANSTSTEIIEPVIDNKEPSRRRVFSPYSGAPRQRASKASRSSASGSRTPSGSGEGTSKVAAITTTTLEPLVSTPPPSQAKAGGGERQKSLSQFNDNSAAASEKPVVLVKAPRGGSSRTAVGLRSNNHHHSHASSGDKGSSKNGGGNNNNNSSRATSETRTGGLPSPSRGVKTTSVLGISRGAAAGKVVPLSPNGGSPTGYAKIISIGISQETPCVDTKGPRRKANGVARPVLPAQTTGFVKSFRQIDLANGDARARTVKGWKV